MINGTLHLGLVWQTGVMDAFDQILWKNVI